MIAVIFEVRPADGRTEAYLDLAAKLRDEPLDESDDEVDRVPSDEDVEEDDISIVDENEGLEEPSARMYVDTAQVTRLLDALGALFLSVAMITTRSI